MDSVLRATPCKRRRLFGRTHKIQVVACILNKDQLKGVVHLRPQYIMFIGYSFSSDLSLSSALVSASVGSSVLASSSSSDSLYCFFFFLPYCLSFLLLFLPPFFACTSSESAPSSNAPARASWFP